MGGMTHVDRSASRARREPWIRRGVRLVLALTGLGLGFPTASQAASAEEYELKAAFLYNFAQFVEWPPQAFAEEDAPFVIGLLGPNPFGGLLRDLVRGEYLQGHPFRVVHFRSVEEVDHCHILFVAGRNPPRLETTLARLAGRNILTVGEAEDFVHRGGTVGFYREGRRVRLRISLRAAQAAGLTISSKLLRVSDVVDATDLGTLTCALRRSNAG